MGKLRLALAALALLAATPASAQSVERWRFHVEEASARFGVPIDWIERVMRAESGGQTMLGGRPIVSHAGAMGLMQLMPGTWAEMRARLGLGADPHAPRDNILAGTLYLRLMYDRFGYPGLFGAYNAGPGRYAEHVRSGRALPGETRAYLSTVAGAPAAVSIASANRTEPPRPTNALFFTFDRAGTGGSAAPAVPPALFHSAPLGGARNGWAGPPLASADRASGARLFLLCSFGLELVAMLLGLILSVTGIVLFAWAMIRLATVALPVGLGAAVFLWAADGPPGPLPGLLLGLIIGVAAFLIGRLALISRLPVPVRGGVALLFAVPAGIAGHSIVSGLMRLGGAGPTPAAIVAVIGAIVVAGTAIMSLLPSTNDPARSHGSALRS